MIIKGFLKFTLLCTETVFTVGYGNFAAETYEGRLFCLIFGIVGIPFMLSVLADVGGVFAGFLQVAWENSKKRLQRYFVEKLDLKKSSK